MQEEPERDGVSAKLGRAAGPVERLEHLRVRQSERVRRAVGCRHEGDRTRVWCIGKRGQVRWPYPRHIGVDDKGDVLEPSECRRNGGALPAARIVHHLHSEAGSHDHRGAVVGDEPNAAAVVDGRLEHVPEHRERDVDADVGRQPALAPGAEGDDDGGHARRLRVSG